MLARMMAVLMVTALLWPFVSGAQEEAPRNLLANPGFELVQDGFPASWRTFDDKARALVALDQDEVFAGEYSLRVTGDPAEGWQPLFSEPLKVEPGSEYTLACYARSQVKRGDGIVFALREINADGQSIRFDHVPVPLQSEWAFCSKKLTLSDKATEIQVFIVLQKCEGNVWFDDVLLVKGDLRDGDALRARKPKPRSAAPALQVPLHSNLLGNGGFERGEAGTRMPQGWTFTGAAGQQGRLDESARFAGRASFRQEHAVGGMPGSALRPAKPIPVTANAPYRLCGWVRTSPGARSAWTTIPSARGQRVEGVCLQLLFLDEKGTLVSQAWSRAIQTNGQWRPLSVVGQAPGNAASAEVRLFHGDLRGASWADSLRLERIEKADDLLPLWMLPRDAFDPGSLPPALSLTPGTGKVEARLAEGAGPDRYSLLVRCAGAGEASGEVALPPVDTSFPGSFRISGECRAAGPGGTGRARLRLSSADVYGKVLATRVVPLPLAGKWQPFHIEETPDPMAASLRVAIAVSGKGMGIEVRQAAVQQTSRLNLTEYAALPGAPAAGPAPAPGPGVPGVEVREHNGFPTLMAGGRPTSLSQYWYSDPVTAPLAGACGRAGLIQVVSVTDIDWSKEPGAIDATRLDADVRQVLKADPGAWIVICPDTTAEHGKVSWVRRHLEECYVSDRGERAVKSYSGETRGFPSFASLKWRDAVNRMLVELIRHVKASDYAGRVIGYQLSGYEWFQWEWSASRLDVSTHVRDAFRRWLTERYGTPERLQAAWGRRGLTLDAVEIPSTEERRRTVDGVFRDPVAQRNVLDFSRFYNEMIADVLIGQARTVKENAGPKTLVSCYYGYDVHMFDSLARESSAHLAVGKLLKSGLIEITGAPTDGYLIERGIGGTGGFMTLPGTHTLHGRLYLDQPDFRTHWSPQDVERTATVEDDVSVYRRELALTLTNGVPIQYLDFSRSWTMGDRRLVEEIRRFGEIERFALTLDRRPSVEGMAVVFSEESADVVGTERVLFDGGLLYHQRPLFFRSGMPHRTYLLSDLANPVMPDHRVWIFPNAFRLTAEERALIQRKCMRSGNVVLFVYAPGIVDEKSASIENASRFLGIELRKLDAPTEAKVRIAPDAATPWLRNSAGITYGQSVWSPLFFADDKNVQVLGTYAGTDKPGLVWKDCGTYKLVYSGAPLLPPGLLRDLGRLAGAHVYSETNDALYADRNFVGIHARTPGRKRVALPRPADVYDLFRRKVVARNVRSFEVEMHGFDTALFYVGDAAKAEAFFQP